MTANFPSFKALVLKKVLSVAIIGTKNLGSGLNPKQVQLIHVGGGYDRLCNVLSTKQRGRNSRLTASKKILRTLSPTCQKNEMSPAHVQISEYKRYM